MRWDPARSTAMAKQNQQHKSRLSQEYEHQTLSRNQDNQKDEQSEPWES